jgi:nuclear pore complex protein Nup155
MPFCRCDTEVQKLIASQTFEDLITTQNGMLVSRALVNVVIDQQIGQQISVWVYLFDFLCLLQLVS